MMNNTVVKAALSLFFIFLMWTKCCYALPFIITPYEVLPTGALQGYPATAAYTVVNNTSRQLNNLIVNTPPNVSVKTSMGCGAAFSLASGASCILYLSITGPVNGQDPNPQNHLYVCLPGRTACAGTNFPLNVHMLDSPLNIYAGSTSGNLTLCTIDEDSGVITGTESTGTPGVTQCTTTGDSPFQAPQWIALAASGQQAYVTDSSAATVWLCNLTNPMYGILGNCQNTNVTGFSAPTGIALNAGGTQAYIADQTLGQVFLCSVNPVTGALSHCMDSGVGNVFNNPVGVAISAASSMLFVANTGNGSNGSVMGCSINANTGTLSGCMTTTTPFTGPFGIAITPAKTQQQIVYVTDSTQSKVYACTNSNGTLTSCGTPLVYTYDTHSSSYITYNFSAPKGIALTTTALTSASPQLSQIYVANFGNNTIALCDYCLESTSCPFASPVGTLICANASIAAINDIVGLTLIS
jgi:hypothetical protein